MGRAVLLAVVLAGGCADRPEADCEACRPRPPSTLFVTDRGGDSILRYDGVTGQFDDVFASGLASRIDRPSSRTLDDHVARADRDGPRRLLGPVTDAVC